MSKTVMSDESKFIMVTLGLFFGIPLFFFMLDRYYFNDEQPSKTAPKELAIVVSGYDKKTGAGKIPPQSVVDKIRDAIKQGDYSVAHVQLRKVDKDSPEYKDLLKTIVAEGMNRKGSGVRKVEETAKTPLRYFDESTPRNRLSDAIYLYIVDYSGTPNPWFCVQSYDGIRQNISSFAIKADGKTLVIKQPAVTTETPDKKFAEYYDAPLTKESYAVAKLLIKSRNAQLIYVGRQKVKEHTITEAEKRGMERILDLYEALGGDIAHTYE